MNLNVSQIQFIIDGLEGQFYDLLDCARNAADPTTYLQKIHDCVDLLIKFYVLKREKMSHES